MLDYSDSIRTYSDEELLAEVDARITRKYLDKKVQEYLSQLKQIVNDAERTLCIK